MFHYPVSTDIEPLATDIMAFKPYGRMSVTVGGEAQATDAEMVSGNYYFVLGVRPQLGRGIQASDDGEIGSGPVVTISDRLWSTRFGRSPDVIGKLILVNATPMTIGGEPTGFHRRIFPTGLARHFFALQHAADCGTAELRFDVVSIFTDQQQTVVGHGRAGRQKSSVSSTKAEVALNVALNAAVRATLPVKSVNQIPKLVLRDGSRGQNPAVEDFGESIYVLIALAGLVLLLACANLANLLLARMASRIRETSTRLALGAGRTASCDE